MQGCGLHPPCVRCFEVADLANVNDADLRPTYGFQYSQYTLPALPAARVMLV